MAFTNHSTPLPAKASERQQLRQHYRQLRAQLSSTEQLAAAEGIHRHLVQCVERLQPRAVGVFLAANGEPSLTPFIHALWQRHITVAVPVLHPICPGHLLFLRYQPNTPMITNHFNIAEPRLQCQNVVPLAELQLLCMPLVAFDSQGNRMGMGGGFYDRTLAQAQRYPLLQRIGIAHDCQQHPQLPSAPWDIPLHQVITPTRVWQFNADKPAN